MKPSLRIRTETLLIVLTLLSGFVSSYAKHPIEQGEVSNRTEVSTSETRDSSAPNSDSE